MTSALPLRTNINDTATDYCCEYTIQRVAASDDYGIYYLTELRQYLVDVHINETILKELFIPALCARDGNRVIVKNSKCAGEFDEILTTFMSRAVEYNMCASRNDNLVYIDRPFFTNGTVYYSRLIYHGPSLAEYVAEHGPFTFAQVEQWLRPVCEAVALLHDNNIWHYAISPYNIQIVKVIETEERAVLMDFGRAIQGLEPRKVLAYPTLTPYLPKEQYTCTRSSQGSTDVYALAATIYFCLTGHDPAYAEELNLDKVCDELLALDIEPERVNELLRALEPKFFKRHRNAREFTDALFAPIPDASEAVSESEPEAAASEPEPEPEPQTPSTSKPGDDEITHAVRRRSYRQPTPQPTPQPAPQPAEPQPVNPQLSSQTNILQRATAMQPDSEPTPQRATAMQANVPPSQSVASVAPPQGRTSTPTPQNAAAPAGKKPAKPSSSRLWIIIAIAAVAIALAAIAWLTFGAGASEEITTADTTITEVPDTFTSDTTAFDSGDSVATEPAPAEQQQPKPTDSSYPNGSANTPVGNHPVSQSSYNEQPTSPVPNKVQIINSMVAGKPGQAEPVCCPNDTVAI